MLLNNTESISGALWITLLDEGTLTETPEKPEGFDEPHDAKSVGVSDMSMLDAIRHTSLEHDVIDHDDMMRLLKAAKRGDINARNRLIETNMRFVFKVAGKFKMSGIPMEDLTHEGMFGIIEAITRFDIDSGHRFSTYAYHWIYHSLVRHIQRHARVVRVPQDIALKQREYFNIINAMGADASENSKRDFAASKLNITPQRLDDILKTPTRSDSFDKPIGSNDSGDGITYHEIITSECSLSDDMEKDDFFSHVWSLCKQCLKEKEKDIVMYRFGFAKKDPMTLEEVSSIIGLTRERVRQIEKTALKKLRHVLHGESALLTMNINQDSH